MRPFSFRSSFRNSVPIPFNVRIPFVAQKPIRPVFDDPGERGILGPVFTPHRRPITVHVSQLKAPLMFWALTIAIAVVTARIVERAAEPYPSEWGTLVDVVVATQPLAAGSPIEASSVVVRSIPSAFAPARPAAQAELAIGRTALDAVAVGGAVDLTRTVPASTSAIVAAVGRGRRGVGLPADAIPLGLRPGDHVDVLVASDGDGSLVGSVRNAQVIVLDDRGALVAMPTADAERLAAARVIGRATLTVVGG